MPSRFVSWLKNSKNKGVYYSFFLPAVFLLCLALLVGTIFMGKDHTGKSLKWGINVIRGSRYPKTTSENIQPRQSTQPQQQPPYQPQLQPSTQRPPSPQPQPPTQQQPSPLPLPQPSRQQQPSPHPPSSHQPSPQPQQQTELQPSPQSQQKPQRETHLPPSPQMQPQTPLQPSPRTQLHVQPETQSQAAPELQPERQTHQAPELQQEMQIQPSSELQPQQGDQKNTSQAQCRPLGSEPLPKGLVSDTSDLQMQPLWGRRKKVNSSTSLFTAAVGIKQKETVDKMVKKFLSSNFNVMLFHYDGVVDAWKELEWANSVVHVSAVNQTKWWFAKRFLHPDIVTEYSHIFLWDEDLGVEHFDPDRYLSIVEDEGLEISQPALDKKSEVHHAITARWKNSTVHRRAKPNGNKHGCDSTSEYPPCAGWIELMAPVFSRAAWRCIWYMIQSDLNHAWGLDIVFGYCAQGDRTKNVGVVDAEYIVHFGFPTFGDSQNKENTSPSKSRLEVRRHSTHEYKIFKKRWQAAAKEDESWVDPYPLTWNHSIM